MAIAGQPTIEETKQSIPTTMRAAVYRGVNDVRVETVSVPKIEAGELLVSVVVRVGREALRGDWIDGHLRRHQKFIRLPYQFLIVALDAKRIHQIGIGQQVERECSGKPNDVLAPGNAG